MRLAGGAHFYTGGWRTLIHLAGERLRIYGCRSIRTKALSRDTCKNYGQTPTRITSQKVRLYLGDSETVSPKWKPFHDDGSIREDYTVAQTSVHCIEPLLEFNGRISPEDRLAVMGATRFLWLCRFIRYRDASDLDESGPLYETRICYVWINNTTRNEPFWIMRGPRDYNRST